MKFVVLGAAALAAATLVGASPASAQVVVKERTVIKEDNGWRRHRADCRVVKTRTRLPNGNVIIKTKRRC